MKGWVDLGGWYSAVVTHQLKVECATGKVSQDRLSCHCATPPTGGYAIWVAFFWDYIVCSHVEIIYTQYSLSWLGIMLQCIDICKIHFIWLKLQSMLSTDHSFVVYTRNRWCPGRLVLRHCVVVFFPFLTLCVGVIEWLQYTIVS